MPSTADVDYRARILGSIDQLPPFSPVLAKVMATLADEDVSFAHLATLIENDTVLAGTILRVVNSPLYGRRATINSVRHAISIVGLVKIRNLVLGLSVTKRWAAARVPRQWSPRLFNLHSLACAVMSDLLVLQAPVNYPEGAFAGGLLHDIGRLLMAIALPADYEQVVALAKERGCSFTDVEQEVFGLSHAEVSGFVLEKWNLPKEIREAVKYHHHPDLPADRPLHLAHIVSAADRFVTRLGYGMTATPPPQPEESFEEPDPLGLNAIAEGLVDSFQEEFDALRAVL